MFGTYERQQRELRRAAGPDGVPDAAKMKEAETQYLSALIKLLNAEQRKDINSINDFWRQTEELKERYADDETLKELVEEKRKQFLRDRRNREIK